MGTTGIRGTQIKDETIESVDIASGSIKKGELNAEAVSSQTAITTVDTTNDMLLIFDATDSALKKVAPTNLGVGGSGSPAGSDTQVQYNNGGSFGAVSGATTDGTNITFGDTALLIGSDIIHSGDTDTFLRFTDDVVVLKAAGKSIVKGDPANGKIYINNGGHDLDFVVKNTASGTLLYTDAGNSRVGIGTDSPSVDLDVSGDVNFDGAAVFNESSADKDFRVESNNNTHMFFVDGGANRIGIGNNSPQTVLDITDPLDGTGAEVDAIIRLRSKKDVGIKLISDTDNSGENDNPFIDFYQDGSTDSTGRSNRLGTIAMEGDAATTFTGSIGNAFFMDAFHPNTGHSSRPLQLANASTNGGHSARITLEGTNGYVGMHTATPTSPVHAYGDVSGTPVMLVDNDNASSGHGLKVTSDGTGTGTNLLDVEAASTTVFRVRGDGRVGIGKVASLPAAVLTVSSSNTDGDIAIAHKIQHIGDSDTFIQFEDDAIHLEAGGRSFIKLSEAGTDKLIINNDEVDLDVQIKGSNMANLLRTDAGNDRVAIGHNSPDAILHIDNGTSNTEVIIEKDAGTSGSIVFHNAGSREADIAFSTNEDIEITNWVADKDITLNIVSGSTEAAALTIDASTGALIANKQFARGVASLNLGSGTTSTIDPAVEGAGTILVTASSITTPNAEPNENIHICTIPDGKTAGQILTVCIITDCLDGSTGLDTMGMLIFAMSTPIPASRAITVVGSALGGTPEGASFTLLWTGSGWMVLSTFGGPA